MAQAETKTPAAVNEIQLSAPWSYQHHDVGSHIHAYIEGLGEWVVVAETQQAGPVNAAKIAEQIVSAVNVSDRYRTLLAEMAAAIDACLDCDGLDFTAEHDGEVTLAKYRELVKERA